MSENKCECPELGETPKNREYMYEEAEKSGMNHQPNKCKGTNEIKLYRRKEKEFWLCSCCYLSGDIFIKSGLVKK